MDKNSSLAEKIPNRIEEVKQDDQIEKSLNRKQKQFNIILRILNAP